MAQGSEGAAQAAIRRSGSSDYGFVLREFASHYAHQLTRRSVLLLVGDARTRGQGQPIRGSVAR